MTIEQVAPPTGRFVAIPSPVALPGACTLCDGHLGPLIDTGISHDHYGAITICFTCLQAMSDVAALSESVATLNQRRAQYTRGYKDGVLKSVSAIEKSLSKIIQGQLDLSRDIEAVISNDELGSDPLSEPTNDDPDSVSPSDSSPEVLLEGTGNVKGDISEPESTAVETDSGSGVEGPDDVPSNSSNGQLPGLPSLSI